MSGRPPPFPYWVKIVSWTVGIVVGAMAGVLLAATAYYVDQPTTFTNNSVTFGTGTSVAISAPQILDDVGSSSVANYSRTVKVGGVNAFRWHTTTALGVHTYNLEYWDGAAWVTALALPGNGSSVEGTFIVIGNFAFGNNSVAGFASGGMLEFDTTDPNAYVTAKGSGPAPNATLFDAGGGAKFVFDDDSDDEADETLAGGNATIDGYYQAGGEGTAGRWWKVVGGTDAGNDCGTCGANETGAFCSDKDGDGSTNCCTDATCAGRTLECFTFTCNGSAWIPNH